VQGCELPSACQQEWEDVPAAPAAAAAAAANDGGGSDDDLEGFDMEELIGDYGKAKPAR
jgi:hypothetical protein